MPFGSDLVTGFSRNPLESGGQTWNPGVRNPGVRPGYGFFPGIRGNPGVMKKPDGLLPVFSASRIDGDESARLLPIRSPPLTNRPPELALHELKVVRESAGNPGVRLGYGFFPSSGPPSSEKPENWSDPRDPSNCIGRENLREKKLGRQTCLKWCSFSREFRLCFLGVAGFRPEKQGDIDPVQASLPSWKKRSDSFERELTPDILNDLLVALMPTFRLGWIKA